MGAARELRTIGDVFHSGPLARQRQRRSYITGMGATLPNWAPPSQVTSETQDAALVLQNYLDVQPTPSVHAYDEAVHAFQVAWNADPNVQGTQAVLDADGAYGSNTQAALDFVTGVAQAVNTGPAPAVDPNAGGGGNAAPPLNLTTPNTTGSPIGVIVLGGAIAFGLWALFFRKKKRGGGTTFELKSNPRRGKGRRRSALLA